MQNGCGSPKNSSLGQCANITINAGVSVAKNVVKRKQWRLLSTARE